MITWEYHSAKFSFYTVKRERAASNFLVGNGQASILLLLVYNITRRSANSTLSTPLHPHHHTPYDDMFDDANDSRIVGKPETAKRRGDLGRLVFAAFRQNDGVLCQSHPSFYLPYHSPLFQQTVLRVSFPLRQNQTNSH